MFPVAGAFGAFSSTGPQCVRRGLPSPQPPRCKQHLAVPTHPSCVSSVLSMAVSFLRIWATCGSEAATLWRANGSGTHPCTGIQEGLLP